METLTEDMRAFGALFAPDQTQLPDPEGLPRISKLKERLRDSGLVIPALPTLYTVEGEIDFQAMEWLMRMQYESGIRTFLIEGTTGESSLHTHLEQEQSIAQAVQIAGQIGNDITIVAGVGSNNTREQNSLARSAIESGAEALLLLPPYYHKGSPDDVIAHLWEGMNHGPSIIYSIQGRTGCEITPDMFGVLCQHPNFLGVKQCDGADSLSALQSLRDERQDDWIIWSGNDPEVVTDLNAGQIDGVITVGGNIAPEPFLEVVCDRALGQSREVQQIVSQVLFGDGAPPNPRGIHNWVEMLYLWQCHRTQELGRGSDPRVFRRPTSAFTLPQQLRFQNIIETHLAEIHDALRVVPFGENYRNVSD